MKKLKTALAALALSLVFAASAPAGDMPTGGITTPPSTSSSSTGDMPTGGLTAETSDDYLDPVTALYLALLSLF